MAAKRIGILLTNLGTPDAPTVPAVRAYLNEFLSDPRVIQLPRWLWLPLLRGVILPLRAKRSAKAYQAIWMGEGSPLSVLTHEQADKLQARLGDGFVVAVGMRYGNPSLQSALRQLAAQQVREIRVLPLYPQFSKTTVESTLMEIERVRRLPEYAALAAIPYHACPAYYQQAPYIQALADSVRAHWQWRGRAQCLLMSFHGLPKSYGKRGDPYGEQCVATAQALARALNLQWNEFQLCFQSRVGRQAWLEPYTEEVLKELPTRGIRSVQVMCPGFAADCLETLEEINIRGREVFLEAGGERFEYIAALNADPAHIEWMAEWVANT